VSFKRKEVEKIKMPRLCSLVHKHLLLLKGQHDFHIFDRPKKRAEEEKVASLQSL